MPFSMKKLAAVAAFTLAAAGATLMPAQGAEARPASSMGTTTVLMAAGQPKGGVKQAFPEFRGHV